VPQRVFLHLGPPKTGTTYLQSLLDANERSFRDQGILIAGTQAEHHEAANELLATTSARGVQVPEGALARLRRKVTAHRGDVVFSCERYSMLKTTHARTLRDAFADREMHAVFTVRDPVAVLPSRWQEKIKNGGTVGWAEFCARVAGERRFLRSMVRARGPLNTWSEVLPAERIHIVTVPAPGASRTLLLERFCEVLGVDLDALATLEASRANRSMDLVGTELLRRLNANPSCRLGPHTQHSEVKTFLADQVLPDRPRVLKPVLTVGAFEAARAESEELVTQIRRGGYPVVGDLADVGSTKTPSPEDHVGHVDAEHLVEAAVESLAALSNRSYDRSLDIAALERGSVAKRAGRRLRGMLSRG
jgi:hypothetical protein